MVDLYVDNDTGDIGLYNKTVRLTANNAELTRQRIEITLKTYRGEWIFSTLEGIPYLENKNNSIQLVGKGVKEDFDSYIKQAVLGKPFVDRISYYASELDIRTGKLSVDMTVEGSDGTPTNVNVNI